MNEGKPLENESSAINVESREVLAATVTEQISSIQETAALIGGEGAGVEDVFELPPAVRDDAPEPDWTPEQQAKARETSGKFGYGAEQNVGSGLVGGKRIIEGGKIWKVMAEIAAFAEEDQPTAMIVAGSPYRVWGTDEREFFIENELKATLPEDSTEAERKATQTSLEAQFPEQWTEYDFARLLAQRSSAHLAEQAVVLPFGYQVTEGNPTVQEATGQLVQIGQTATGQDVQLLRIDREIYEEEGKQKYRYQPGTETVMRIVSDVMAMEGRHDEPVALITSTRYTSRVQDAVSAGLKYGRQFGVAMYGRRTLAEVKDEPMTPELPLNQLPGDLRVTYDKLLQLKDELGIR